MRRPEDIILEQTPKRLAAAYALNARITDDVGNTDSVHPDAIYIMGHNTSFQDYNLARGAALARKTPWSVPILIFGDDAVSSYPGGPAWRRKLIEEYEVDPRRIVLVRGGTFDDNGTPRAHSLSEAGPVIRWCAENNVQRLIIVAPPFHITRCFVGFVTALRKAEVDGTMPIDIFAATTRRIRWDEHAVHSQGTEEGTPNDFAAAEFAKLFYKDYGLLPPEEVIRYLAERDVRIRAG